MNRDDETRLAEATVSILGPNQARVWAEVLEAYLELRRAVVASARQGPDGRVCFNTKCHLLDGRHTGTCVGIRSALAKVVVLDEGLLETPKK